MSTRQGKSSADGHSVLDQPVESRLCLALHAAARAMDRAYRPLLEPLDLTYPQYLVMSLLWEQDHQRTSALAQQTSLDPSTVSPLVRRLESGGLVTRHRDPTDDRVVLISLTPNGRRLRTRAQHIPTDVCDATGLTAHDRDQLVADLHALAAHLGAQHDLD